MTETRRLAAVMFTDIVSYTSLMSRDEQQALAVLEKNRTLQQTLTKRHNGEFLKEMGDGTLLCFQSALDAVRCAVAIQESVKEEPDLNLRIGIHLGDIVFKEGDIYGDGVNVASRIEGLAKPGGICISGHVYLAVKNQQGITAQWIGKKRLKNVNESVQIYNLVALTSAKANNMTGSKGGIPSFPAKTKRAKSLWLAAIILAVIVAVLLLGPLLKNPGKIAGGECQHSIAVLPFVDMSPDKDQEYFCDGIAEELINTLTRVSQFRVTARTSAFSFKGKDLDIPTIGKKLNVEMVLEGSVRKSDDNLRITAQLINVADGYHIWSEAYNRKLRDVFAIQADISRSIAETLKISLLKEEETTFKEQSTADIDAYNLYLKGRYFWRKRTEEGFRKSLEYFQQAIDKDPEYALAYVGKADALILLVYWGYMAPAEGMPEAKNLLLEALDINDSLAEAYATRGFIEMDYDWDWDAAEASFTKALELNPNYALAYHWYGSYCTSQGQLEKGLEMSKKALTLDPLSLQINANFGETLLMMNRLDDAEGHIKKTLEMDPSFSYAHQVFGHIYSEKGQLDMALEEYQKARDIPWTVALIGSNYALTGKEGKAREVIAQLKEHSKEKYVRPSAISGVYFSLGDYEKAFDWLENAVEERDPVMPWVRYVVPELDDLHSHPRFKAILEKMDLNR